LVKAFQISSIATKDFKDSQQPKQLSLDEYLMEFLGFFVLNRTLLQRLRISLRGFGARSAFGIRGIKIAVDGIQTIS
jgi:iron complex outermembrane receptor protein